MPAQKLSDDSDACGIPIGLGPKVDYMREKGISLTLPNYMELVGTPILERRAPATGGLFLIGKDDQGNRILPPSISVASGEVFTVTQKRVFGQSTMTGFTAEVSLTYFKFMYVTGTFRIEETLDKLGVLPGPGVLTIDIASNEQRFTELWRNNSGIVFGYEITSRSLHHKHPV